MSRFFGRKAGRLSSNSPVRKDKAAADDELQVLKATYTSGAKPDIKEASKEAKILGLALDNDAASRALQESLNSAKARTASDLPTMMSAPASGHSAASGFLGNLGAVAGAAAGVAGAAAGVAARATRLGDSGKTDISKISAQLTAQKAKRDADVVKRALLNTLETCEKMVDEGNVIALEVAAFINFRVRLVSDVEKLPSSSLTPAAAAAAAAAGGRWSTSGVGDDGGLPPRSGGLNRGAASHSKITNSFKSVARFGGGGVDSVRGASRPRALSGGAMITPSAAAPAAASSARPFSMGSGRSSSKTVEDVALRKFLEGVISEQEYKMITKSHHSAALAATQEKTAMAGVGRGGGGGGGGGDSDDSDGEHHPDSLKASSAEMEAVLKAAMATEKVQVVVQCFCRLPRHEVLRNSGRVLGWGSGPAIIMTNARWPVFSSLHAHFEPPPAALPALTATTTALLAGKGGGKRGGGGLQREKPLRFSEGTKTLRFSELAPAVSFGDDSVASLTPVEESASGQKKKKTGGLKKKASIQFAEDGATSEPTQNEEETPKGKSLQFQSPQESDDVDEIRETQRGGDNENEEEQDAEEGGEERDSRLSKTKRRNSIELRPGAALDSAVSELKELMGEAIRKVKQNEKVLELLTQNTNEAPPHLSKQVTDLRAVASSQEANLNGLRMGVRQVSSHVRELDEPKKASASSRLKRQGRQGGQGSLRRKTLAQEVDNEAALLEQSLEDGESGGKKKKNNGKGCSFSVGHGDDDDDDDDEAEGGSGGGRFGSGGHGDGSGSGQGAVGRRRGGSGKKGKQADDHLESLVLFECDVDSMADVLRSLQRFQFNVRRVVKKGNAVMGHSGDGGSGGGGQGYGSGGGGSHNGYGGDIHHGAVAAAAAAEEVAKAAGVELESPWEAQQDAEELSSLLQQHQLNQAQQGRLELLKKKMADPLNGAATRKSVAVAATAAAAEAASQASKVKRAGVACAAVAAAHFNVKKSSDDYEDYEEDDELDELHHGSVSARHTSDRNRTLVGGMGAGAVDGKADVTSSLRLLFRAVDTDGSGEIDADELQAAMTELGLVDQQALTSHPHSSAGSGSYIFDCFLRDGSWGLGFDEFEQLIRNRLHRNAVQPFVTHDAAYSALLRHLGIDIPNGGRDRSGSGNNGDGGCGGEQEGGGVGGTTANGNSSSSVLVGPPSFDSMPGSPTLSGTRGAGVGSLPPSSLLLTSPLRRAHTASGALVGGSNNGGSSGGGGCASGGGGASSSSSQRVRRRSVLSVDPENGPLVVNAATAVAAFPAAAAAAAQREQLALERANQAAGGGSGAGASSSAGGALSTKVRRGSLLNGAGAATILDPSSAPPPLPPSLAPSSSSSFTSRQQPLSIPASSFGQRPGDNRGSGAFFAGGGSNHNHKKLSGQGGMMMTDATAQVRLGHKSLKQKRWGMAHDWFLKAAAQGSSEAALEVGRLHDLGLHDERDEGQSGGGGGRGGGGQGGGGGMMQLSSSDLGGGGGGRDLAGAVHFYDLAARGGEARAMFKLALWYRDGEGVLKDHAVSDQWMRLAGDHGMPSAQFHLAAKLFKQAEVLPPKLGERLCSQGVTWLKRAASQGHGPAMLELGRKHVSKTNSGVAFEPELAMRLFEQAVEFGLQALLANQTAQRNRRESTENKAARDRRGSAELDLNADEGGGDGAGGGGGGSSGGGGGLMEGVSEKAAAATRAAAEYELAKCYRDGVGSSASPSNLASPSSQPGANTSLAVSWMEQAAEHGHSEAMFDLSFMIAHGDGRLAADAVLAVQWLRRAAEVGHSKAAQLLERQARGRGFSVHEDDGDGDGDYHLGSLGGAGGGGAGGGGSSGNNSAQNVLDAGGCGGGGGLLDQGGGMAPFPMPELLDLIGPDVNGGGGGGGGASSVLTTLQGAGMSQSFRVKSGRQGSGGGEDGQGGEDGDGDDGDLEGKDSPARDEDADDETDDEEAYNGVEVEGKKKIESVADTRRRASFLALGTPRAGNATPNATGGGGDGASFAENDEDVGFSTRAGSASAASAAARLRTTSANRREMGSAVEWMSNPVLDGGGGGSSGGNPMLRSKNSPPRSPSKVGDNNNGAAAAAAAMAAATAGRVALLRVAESDLLVKQRKQQRTFDSLAGFEAERRDVVETALLGPGSQVARLQGSMSSGVSTLFLQQQASGGGGGGGGGGKGVSLRRRSSTAESGDSGSGWGGEAGAGGGRGLLLLLGAAGSSALPALQELLQAVESSDVRSFDRLVLLGDSWRASAQHLAAQAVFQLKGRPTTTKSEAVTTTSGGDDAAEELLLPASFGAVLAALLGDLAGLMAEEARRGADSVAQLVLPTEAARYGLAQRAGDVRVMVDSCVRDLASANTSVRVAWAGVADQHKAATRRRHAALSSLRRDIASTTAATTATTAGAGAAGVAAKAAQQQQQQQQAASSSSLVAPGLREGEGPCHWLALDSYRCHLASAAATCRAAAKHLEAASEVGSGLRRGAGQVERDVVRAACLARAKELKAVAGHCRRLRRTRLLRLDGGAPSEASVPPLPLSPSTDPENSSSSGSSSSSGGGGDGPAAVSAAVGQCAADAWGTSSWPEDRRAREAWAARRVMAAFVESGVLERSRLQLAALEIDLPPSLPSSPLLSPTAAGSFDPSGPRNNNSNGNNSGGSNGGSSSPVQSFNRSSRLSGGYAGGRREHQVSGAYDTAAASAGALMEGWAAEASVLLAGLKSADTDNDNHSSSSGRALQSASALVGASVSSRDVLRRMTLDKSKQQQQQAPPPSPLFPDHAPVSTPTECLLKFEAALALAAEAFEAEAAKLESKGGRWAVASAEDAVCGCLDMAESQCKAAADTLESSPLPDPLPYTPPAQQAFSSSPSPSSPDSSALVAASDPPKKLTLAEKAAAKAEAAAAKSAVEAGVRRCGSVRLCVLRGRVGRSVSRSASMQVEEDTAVATNANGGNQMQGSAATAAAKAQAFDFSSLIPPTTPMVSGGLVLTTGGHLHCFAGPSALQGPSPFHDCSAPPPRDAFKAALASPAARPPLASVPLTSLAAHISSGSVGAGSAARGNASVETNGRAITVAKIASGIFVLALNPSEEHSADAATSSSSLSLAVGSMAVSLPALLLSQSADSLSNTSPLSPTTSGSTSGPVESIVISVGSDDAANGWIQDILLAVAAKEPPSSK